MKENEHFIVPGKITAELVNEDTTTSCTEDSMDAKAASPATPASPSDNSDSAVSTPRAKRYIPNIHIKPVVVPAKLTA